MAAPALFFASKTLALEIRNILLRELQGVTLHSAEQRHYPTDGGDVDIVTFARGKDKAELVAYLGDRSSPDGPFDGECWLVIHARPWWRKRWNKLARDLENVITAHGGRE